MWREQGPSSQRVHRTVVIGTAEQYPTEELARAAVNGLRSQINEEQNRHLHQAIRVSELIDHYLITEPSTDGTRHSHATRIIYREFLLRRINHTGARSTLDMCARLQLKVGLDSCSAVKVTILRIRLKQNYETS